ncbi:angiopoietin-related protein 4-like [Anopheles albimanus]|uniref:angiopoietin-related protein 4-like n=1 Tax=Anopheles albimanus TaxID=7167 RepID=UPI0007D62240|nr:angiopoietin-related protein 4-like [Anopheles albimanus]
MCHPKVSGVYLIGVHYASPPFKVYCEQVKFGGGWIVIQHRFNGSVDFNSNWNEYRDGFGSFDSEFWLGLEHIHQLTTARNHEVIIEMRDFEGNYGTLVSIHFKAHKGSGTSLQRIKMATSNSEDNASILRAKFLNPQLLQSPGGTNVPYRIE